MYLTLDKDDLLERLARGEEIWFFIYEYSFHNGVGTTKRHVEPTRVGDLKFYHGNHFDIHLMGKRGKPIAKCYNGMSQDYNAMPLPLFGDKESCIKAYKEAIQMHLDKLNEEFERDKKWRTQNIETVMAAQLKACQL